MPSTPSIDADRYRAVMGRFVTGVTVVTTLDEPDALTGEPQPFGTTVNSSTSVSLDPPRGLLTIRRTRPIPPVLATT